MFQQFMFYVLATLSVVAGFNVIRGQNPISCAVSLIVTLGSVAGLFVLLDAHFVATIQILVYAGAIMVLFIFVIMLLNLHPHEMGEPQITAVKGIGVLLTVAALALLTWRFMPIQGVMPPVPAQYGTLEQIGVYLFSSYLLPFEVVSILLTAAVVGAVVIAKRDM